LIITYEDYKEYRKKEMINALSNGSLIDEGVDKLLIDIFIKCGTELFIDVGCNRGDYLELLSEKYKDVNILAFEPDTRIYNQCLKKYENNEKIKLYNKGIANKNKKLKFYFDDDSTQTSAKYSSSKDYIITKSEKLDNYYNYIKNFKNPFIKIDAEGLEPEILYSSKKILKDMSNIILYFEYSYKWNFNEKEVYNLFKYLVQNKFVLYRLNAFGLEQIPVMYYQYLKDFHFSNIIAIKGFVFRKEDLSVISSKYGNLNSFKLVDSRELGFE